MELRQLRYFVQVVELMNFTEASKKLFISQSTLSQQIMQLEAELDVKFFIRNGKRILLTEEGRTFYPYAKDCLQKSKDAVTILRDLKEFTNGEIRIGVTFGLRQIIAQAIVEFRKFYPNIKIIADFGSSNEMIEKLKKNEIDLLINFDMDLDENIFEKKELFVSSVCLIAPFEHSVSVKNKIKIQELNDYDLITQSNNSNIWKFLRTVVENVGIELKTAMEVNDNPTLIELIKNNIGLGIMADVTVKNEKNLKPIPIDDKKMKRKVWMMTLKNTYLTKKTEAFYDIIRKVVSV